MIGITAALSGSDIRHCPITTKVNQEGPKGCNTKDTSTFDNWRSFQENRGVHHLSPSYSFDKMFLFKQSTIITNPTSWILPSEQIVHFLELTFYGISE